MNITNTTDFNYVYQSQDLANNTLYVHQDGRFALSVRVVSAPEQSRVMLFGETQTTNILVSEDTGMYRLALESEKLEISQ